MPVTMFSVDSTHITAIGYDDEQQALYIMFGPHTYLYHGVPTDLWERFKAAESKGRFFREFIKGQYRGERQ